MTRRTNPIRALPADHLLVFTGALALGEHYHKNVNALVGDLVGITRLEPGVVAHVVVDMARYGLVEYHEGVPIISIRLSEGLFKRAPPDDWDKAKTELVMACSKATRPWTPEWYARMTDVASALGENIADLEDYYVYLVAHDFLVDEAGKTDGPLSVLSSDAYKAMKARP